MKSIKIESRVALQSGGNKRAKQLVMGDLLRNRLSKSDVISHKGDI